MLSTISTLLYLYDSWVVRYKYEWHITESISMDNQRTLTLEAWRTYFGFLFVLRYWMLFTDGGYYHPILRSVRTYIYAVEAWQLIHPNYRHTNNDPSKIQIQTQLQTNNRQIKFSEASVRWCTQLDWRPGSFLTQVSGARELSSGKNNCIILTIFALIPDV